MKYIVQLLAVMENTEGSLYNREQNYFKQQLQVTVIIIETKNTRIQ